MMDQDRWKRPDEGQHIGANHQKVSATETTTIVADAAEIPEQLVARADRVVRAALREGITGPDTEQLLEWVARHRVQRRRHKARANVTAVLDEIAQAEGVVRP